MRAYRAFGLPRLVPPTSTTGPDGTRAERSAAYGGSARNALVRFASARPLAADLLLFAAVGLAYSAGSLISYSWFGALVSPTFFPSAGVTVGALVLVAGVRRRALVLAAAATAEICVNVFHGGIDVAPSAGFALANVSEASLAAFLIVAIARGAPLVERRGLAGPVVGVLVAPWLGGSIAAAVTELDGGDVNAASYLGHWWLGDALGILLVGGGLIAAATEERRHGRFDGELAVFVLASAISAGAALWWDVWPAGYVPFVLPLVAAWRVGALGAVATAGVAATVVAEAAASGEWLFGTTGVGPEALVYVQVAIGVVVVTALVLVVLLHERAEAILARQQAASQAEVHARRALELADEQAALRRVATLVALESSPTDIFAAVTEEARRIVEREAVGLLRFEPDGTATLVAQSETPWDPPPLGTRITLDGENVIVQLHRTGQAARVDRWAGSTGAVAAMATALGVRSTVASPVVVEGRLWGTILAVTSQSEPLPAEMESRIAQFTGLVATAIANAEGRAELAASEARAHELANEQAALRRVATLVAQGASPDDGFSAVAEEVAGIIDIPVVGINRFEADGTFTMLGLAGETRFTVGSRWPVEDEGIAGIISATGRPARWDDYSAMSGRLGEAIREDVWSSTIGVPIVVDGSVWGFLGAATRPGKPIPEDTEQRLVRFTELVATAVSNTTTRTELLSSRARVVSAADETRRRLERDLHDGIQQWLVALALRARKAASMTAADDPISNEISGLADDLVAVTDELREISRGIHPAILSDAGLDDALKALARRSSVPVHLEVEFRGRYDLTLEA